MKLFSLILCLSWRSILYAISIIIYNYNLSTCILLYTYIFVVDSTWTSDAKLCYVLLSEIVVSLYFHDFLKYHSRLNKKNGQVFVPEIIFVRLSRFDDFNVCSVISIINDFSFTQESHYVNPYKNQIIWRKTNYTVEVKKSEMLKIETPVSPYFRTYLHSMSLDSWACIKWKLYSQYNFWRSHWI